MNRNLNDVFSVIERKILESIRLIENEEFFVATQIIFESRNNLLRIRNVISNDTFNTLNNNCDRLKQICDDNQNIINSNRRPYVALRLNNLGKFRKVIITFLYKHCFLGRKRSKVHN